jgi:hypothetical protein
MSWLASALGLAGGIAAAYYVANPLLPVLVQRSPDRLLAVRLALGGTIVALAPAFLLALVAGATLGGAWGGATGLALGVAFVFALVLLSGAAAGVLLARLLYRRSSRT